MLSATLTERSTVRLGISLCLLSMLVFAVQDAITKVLVQDMAVSQFIAVRYWVFALFALCYVHFKGGIAAALHTHYPVYQLLRSFLSVVEIAIFNLSLRYLGLSEAHAILALFPLLAVMMAGPMLGETIGAKRMCAVLVGLMGALIIIRPGFGLFRVEALIPLSAAFIFAFYNLITRKVSAKDSFNTNMLYMALVGCALSSVFAIGDWQPASAEQWQMMLVLSVTGIAGHLFLVKALEFAPAALLQPFNYSLLVFATLIGWWVFDELPDNWTLVGASIVISSGLYAIRQSK